MSEWCSFVRELRERRESGENEGRRGAQLSHSVCSVWWKKTGEIHNACKKEGFISV